MSRRKSQLVCLSRFGVEWRSHPFEEASVLEESVFHLQIRDFGWFPRPGAGREVLESCGWTKERRSRWCKVAESGTVFALEQCRYLRGTKPERPGNIRTWMSQDWRRQDMDESHPKGRDDDKGNRPEQWVSKHSMSEGYEKIKEIMLSKVQASNIRGCKPPLALK